jgi:hypothetical protein
VLNRSFDSEFEDYSLCLNQIEKFSLILKSQGTDKDDLWQTICKLPNLKTFQLQMNFIDAKLEHLHYFDIKIENLVLNILPISNYNYKKNTLSFLKNEIKRIDHEHL